MSTDQQPEENTLKIFVSEDIKMDDVPPGTPAPKSVEVPIGEALPTEAEMKQMMLEHAVKLLQRYVPPHTQKSRWVTKEDLPRVLEEAKIMAALIGVRRGMYGNVHALAHSQIEDKDPLRFFFTNTGMTVINPVIFNHTKHPVFNPEGCMTYPDEPMKELVTRFNKIDAYYQTLYKDGDKEVEISPRLEGHYTGFESRMWQHESQHLNGANIYTDHDPMQGVAFGDGTIPSQEELDNMYKPKE